MHTLETIKAVGHGTWGTWRKGDGLVPKCSGLQSIRSCRDRTRHDQTCAWRASTFFRHTLFGAKDHVYFSLAQSRYLSSTTTFFSSPYVRRNPFYIQHLKTCWKIKENLSILKTNKNVLEKNSLISSCQCEHYARDLDQLEVLQLPKNDICTSSQSFDDTSCITQGPVTCRQFRSNYIALIDFYLNLYFLNISPGSCQYVGIALSD